MRKRKITVVGSGYVGLSLAMLFAQHNKVVILDIDSARVDQVNAKQSTVADEEIEAFLEEKKLDISATLDRRSAYQGASFVVVATPTNYDTDQFDTSSVDGVVEDALEFNKEVIVVIKSTIPVGHTKSLQERYKTNRIMFSPEFLREGQALKDNLYPSRIIVGGQLENAKEFADLLMQGAQKKNIETLFVGETEAEAIKLFANTYLAMRISFFNELDSYGLDKALDIKSIIEGVCLDERIGKGYNNPSFGYGGYCLPKDTKQLLANYENVPQNLIQAIVSSNQTRKDFLSNWILDKKPAVVGFYRLIMKEGSDNFRSSAILGLISRIREAGIEIIIYEPDIEKSYFNGIKVINSLTAFKEISDIVIANRNARNLNDIQHKVFTRDIYGVN
ncbi:nucleotide sugar dehydrogenase [Gammaproteobacteria bacterium]|nr:nucleotide sugar dehydrogenase [Gammaproteobacteria bacterium]MDB3877681.1 nucleotide sugar dehydrogenase [Gammaproteobacteria bacterium]MDC0089995.1 nucleotide sugar dehydrogenase [Gammaproteobacteria bacterium]